MTPVITLSHTKGSLSALRAFADYDTHISIVAMDKHHACSLMQHARALNMTWPDYAWITLSNDLEIANASSAGCVVLEDGAFLLGIEAESSKFHRTKEDSVNLGLQNVATNKTLPLPTFFGLDTHSILFDSIIAVAFAQNQSLTTVSNFTYHGLTGEVKFQDGVRQSGAGFQWLFEKSGKL